MPFTLVPVAVTALAQAQPPGAGGGIGGMLLLLVPIMLIMYFFLIRPQQKRQKQHEAMLKAIQAGDKVVTTGGIVGTVVRADDSTLRLRIAPSVEVNVVRSYVAGKAGEGDPAP